MAGTGLPIPKSGGVLSQAPAVMDGDSLYSAREWSRVSASFERLSNTGLDLYERDAKLQAAGALADFEEKWRNQNIEARNKFAKDPEGFKNWAESSIDGAIAEVPRNIVPHAKQYLTRTFDGSYSAILSEKRAQDDRLATQALDARAKSAMEDTQALVAGGKAFNPDGTLTPEYEGALKVYNSVLDVQVKSGKLAQEEADYRKDDLTTKNQGEETARQALKIYQEKGFEAAVEHLTTNVRDNDKLSLKPTARQAIFNRGLSAINLQRNADREDRVEIENASKELRTRIESNQSYDPSEVRDVQKQLLRFGSHRELALLNKSLAVQQEVNTVRGLPLRDIAGVVQQMRGDLTGKYESGGDWGMAHKDNIGWSYGKYQFNSRGSLNEFMRDHPDIAGKFAGLDPESSAFAARWRQVANEMGPVFQQAQQETFLKRAQPSVDKAQSLGFKVGDRGVMEAVLSGTIQHGKWDTVLASAASKPGFSTMSEPDQIKTLYEARAAYVAGLSTLDENTKAAVLGRYKSEMRDAIAMTGKEAGPLPDFVSNRAAPRGEGAVGPYAAAATERVQKQFVEQTRKAWGDFKKAIESGKVLDDEDMIAMRYGAHLSKDNAFINEVEAFYEANRIALETKDQPGTTRQFILDKLEEKAQQGGFSVEGRTVLNALAETYKKQDEQVRNDPVSWAVEQGRAPPIPLDFKNPQAVGVAIEQRVKLAKAVAQDQGVPAGNPFRSGDRAAIAGAIIGGSPQEAAAAFEGLAKLPEEFLQPAIGNKQIKDAVAGAARSGDPARFNAAMSFLDRSWARNPDMTKAVFGEDVLREMMRWQTNLRYMTPEQVAKERERQALDPQVRERQKALETAGGKEARKVSFDQVMKGFDESYLPGNQALPPLDRTASDTLKADFDSQFARFFAENQGDKEKALENTFAMLKTKWKPSTVNGGRLMLNAPEHLYDGNGKAIYPAVNGSHDWMTQQIEKDIGDYLEKPVMAQGKGFQYQGRAWNYEIVPDRQTEVERQRGAAPSYVVVVKDAVNGKSTVLPYRYSWDAREAQDAAERQFMADRKANLARTRPMLPKGDVTSFYNRPEPE